MRRSALENLHPASVFAFFIGAIIISILESDLRYQVVGIALSIACYISLKGKSGWKLVCSTAPILLIIALINPLFNLQGSTVIFTWAGRRPYTMEALAYGASTSLMFGAVLFWFLSYSSVFSTDRITYLFGRIAPSLTLLITMVLRLIPEYSLKLREISSVRECIGLTAHTGSLKRRLSCGAANLNALFTQTLEDSLIKADSMQSRGYGCKRRSRYSFYEFDAIDRLFVGSMLMMIALFIVASTLDYSTVEYFPQVFFPALTPTGVVALLAFSLFLSLPLLSELAD